ncbi:hypothetical protein GJ496_010825 [Pomphorhynchus laevis]|nr:hypothetical protein GJ496_010825 [Pomphorhynchus laevis]
MSRNLLCELKLNSQLFIKARSCTLPFCHRTLDQSIRSSSSRNITEIRAAELNEVMIRPDKIKCCAMFVRREVDIRLAKSISILNSIQKAFPIKNAIFEVRQSYINAYKALQTLPDTQKPFNLNKTWDILEFIDNVIPFVLDSTADAVIELPECFIASDYTDELNSELDSFFILRISIRTICNQLRLLCYCDVEGLDPQLVDNCFVSNINLLEFIRKAWLDASNVWQQDYSETCPHYIINDDSSGKLLIHIPSYLHHILFELIKNAMQALKECSLNLDEEPVKINLKYNPSYTFIEIINNGGSLSIDDLENVFKYRYRVFRSECKRLSGLGYGLPLSRLYARFLSGDIMLENTENGRGVKSVLSLRNQFEEKLENFSHLKKMP